MRGVALAVEELKMNQERLVGVCFRSQVAGAALKSKPLPLSSFRISFMLRQHTCIRSYFTSVYEADFLSFGNSSSRDASYSPLARTPAPTPTATLNSAIGVRSSPAVNKSSAKSDPTDVVSTFVTNIRQ